MSIAISCKSKNIFYHGPDALQITNRLCACPAVHSLLASFEDSVSINVRTGSYPGIRVGFSPEDATYSEIQIPKQALKQKDTLGNFALEIFNVKNREKIVALNNRALNGDVDIEKYAKGMETIEFESREGAIDLSLQCGFLKKSGMKDITRDLEIHLWNKEFDCHTDKIRQRWIESSQQAYCQKNPGKKSCKIQPQNLCDFYQAKSLSKDEHYLFRINRICERLSELPQKVKDWYPSEVAYCHLKDEL